MHNSGHSFSMILQKIRYTPDCWLDKDFYYDNKELHPEGVLCNDLNKLARAAARIIVDYLDHGIPMHDEAVPIYRIVPLPEFLNL